MDPTLAAKIAKSKADAKARREAKMKANEVAPQPPVPVKQEPATPTAPASEFDEFDDAMFADDAMYAAMDAACSQRVEQTPLQDTKSNMQRAGSFAKPPPTGRVEASFVSAKPPPAGSLEGTLSSHFGFPSFRAGSLVSPSHLRWALSAAL